LFDFLEKHKSKLIYIPLVLYWLTLFIFTTLPSKDLPKTGINDKIEHLSAYFILTTLLSLALLFQNKSIKTKKNFSIASIFIVAVYAALDEIHQLFIPGRDCDILDWTADMIGAVIGIFLIIILVKIFQNNRNSQFS
jgi:VanZ family protein